MGRESRKLLVLASTYPRWPGDPEPGFVHELARRLTSRFDITVLCPHAAGAATIERMDGVKIIRYRYAPQAWETLVNDGGIVTNLRRAKWKYLLLPGFVLAQVWVAWRLLRRSGIDVVHAHWLVPQGLVAMALHWLSGGRVAYLVTSHGADLYALQGRLSGAVKRLVSRRAAGVTVVSSSMRQRLDQLGVDARKVSILPMGVDLRERFKADASVTRAARELLFVGRLVEKKGVQYLLEAMPLVKQRFPDASLSVVGFGPDESALRAQADRLGITDSVRFVGAVPQAELPAIYQRAALFVAPFIRAESGDQEGLPVALMEAVACGCPVVAGEVAGIGDLLGSCRKDVCVDARNVPQLAQKIVNALVHPEAAAAQARRILDHAAEYVSWERIADAYGQLLEVVVSSGRGHEKRS